MPTLIQISVVIVTLACVALVTTTIITLVRLGEAATRMASAAQQSLAQVERLVLETNQLVTAAREITPAARNVVTRFQQIGDRVADLSSAVLDEIETPVATAVAVARGMRTGTSHLLERLNRRFAERSTSNNGDHDHE